MVNHRFQLEWADLSDGPDDSVVENPTPEDLEAILGVLADSESGFVILSRDEDHFLQAAAPAEPGAPLTIEYRAGQSDTHHEIAEDVFGGVRLFELFRLYLQKPDAIAQAAAWRRLKL